MSCLSKRARFLLKFVGRKTLSLMFRPRNHLKEQVIPEQLTEAAFGADEVERHRKVLLSRCSSGRGSPDLAVHRGELRRELFEHRIDGDRDAS